MNKSAKLLYVLTLLNIALVTTVLSGTFTPKEWVSGETLTAADLNALISAVNTAVTDNNTRTGTLETALATANATISILVTDVGALQTDLTTANGKITTLETNTSNLQGINPYVALVNDASTHSSNTVQFSGVNVKIINGVAQGTPNGVGNLIVGYDGASTVSGTEKCSDGQYDTMSACTVASEIWSISHKTGSHNLVGGNNNNYSQTAGVVFGNVNTSNSTYGSVTGGARNTASGFFSSVTGGWSNTSSGNYSSVSGGQFNITSGPNTSVSGGFGCDSGATNSQWIVGFSGSTGGCSANNN